jgi:signal transduction histidine kinase
MSAQLKNHFIDYRTICGHSGDLLTDDMPCTGMTVIGYPNEFKHVIINIINNAKDAIIERIEKGELPKDGGEIIMEVSKEDGTLIIKISDNGGGIPPEVKEKIFEPYFSTKGDAKGTGIGLYMSKAIIEGNMDGNLYCKDIENGTVFVIELKEYHLP